MWAKALLLSATFAASALTAPAHGGPRPQFQQPSPIIAIQDRRDRGLRQLPQIISDLQARYGGQYLGYRLEDGSPPIYVIRWRMPDGEVRDFRVPAR
jgi:hypothetical protein